tara:strand:- start:1595 stop:1927 length:333 start_codon:yes stop_codon:yes gene_type:complete
MKVRLSYHANLDEIPSKVAGLIENNMPNMSQVMDKLSVCVRLLNEHEESTSIVKSQLDSMRKTLSDVDIALSDCHTLLEGYDSAIEQIMEQTNETAPSQESIAGLSKEEE